MSESITHTAVVDDCARLAQRSQRICAAFKACLERHLEAARLGGVTRAGDHFTPGLLADLREEPQRVTDDEAVGQRLAFVLGWICHRATDRQMKPIFRAADPDSPVSPTDCSVYHDVYVLREVYGAGGGPYTAELLDPGAHRAAEAVNVEKVEELLRVLAQRALVALHTLIPDADDPAGWVDRVLAARARFKVDLGRYAEAFVRPDPDKVRRFITEVNFYDPSDPLIRLARSSQRGAPDEGVDLEAALDGAEGQSEYARALRRSALYLIAASEYFERKIGEDELRERLDIGKPGG